ncbi:amidase [Noviherbaspirillum pedocola]|uniref:Amidase n=1 Tax=Noviherbaspirillum pedocola TaxID=2801341 RepID=A0A934W6P7_9BURK|nr:amidase [Noviherbaspirillum pedocola]MBK4735385.1 amidase [Noviherbaspirillum pedocola]
MRAEPWMLSASALARAYRDGDLSPVQALQSVLARMDAVNPAINAVVTCDREAALAAAARSQARWREGRALSALDGVPFTVKDNLATAGMRSTFGSRLYADHVPDSDELPVARLLGAGAVLLGKTNVPELALHGYTDNALFGVTRNPWNTALTPGGSSGGAAAAVAAGIAPLALATDGGGSIRRPCAHTGCVGLKPGTGRVPRSGGFPVFLHDFEVAGPIARCVDDLILAMHALSPSSSQDARSAVFADMPFSAAPHVSAARIALIDALGDAPVDAESAQAAEEALRSLAALGHRPVSLPPAQRAALVRAITAINEDAWPVLSTSGLAWLMATHFPGRESALSPPLAVLLEQGRARSGVDMMRALEAIRHLRQTLAQVLHDIDCLLLPSAASQPWQAAEPHPPDIAGQPVGPRGHAIFTAFVNAAGLPAVALPVGMSTGGMPLGVQLVGRHGADGWLCALGRQLEGTHQFEPLWRRHATHEAGAGAPGMQSARENA